MNIAEQIVRIGKLLYQKNFLAACDGNISVREGDTIYITPSGVPKGFLEASQIVTMDLEGKSEHRPSSEKLMHLAIYQNAPKARAVIHAHPPASIAWTIAHPHLEELPRKSMSELILAAGKIPILPYARPGTQAMGEVVIPHLPERRAFILARHGALCWGEDLLEAFNGMERLEHSALILMHAASLGGITELPASEIEALETMRKSLGEKIL